MTRFQNSDIDIDKVIFENNNINIDKVVCENIDIDKVFFENICIHENVDIYIDQVIFYYTCFCNLLATDNCLIYIYLFMNDSYKMTL